MTNTEAKMEYTATERMTMAKEIVAQIKAGDPMALPAWAARDFVVLNGNEKFSMGLQFRVTCPKVKGIVSIRLAWDDTYTVTTQEMRRGQFIEKAKVEGVYCDNLVPVIDGLVG